MKPNFALDLSHDGIRLLFRDKGGWARLGEVALDDPNMSVALADLRKIAEGLAHGPIAAKLVVPNSQILYTTLEAPGPDDAAREMQIRVALEGMTPYAVSDLVFDWRADGQTARVAVLAKETMDEAEGFADQFGFNPVSFVARPESGHFSGEPFFGKTRAAARILPSGERVLPDATPVPRNPRQMDLPTLATGASTAPDVTAKPAKTDSLDPFPDLPAELTPEETVSPAPAEMDGQRPAPEHDVADTAKATAPAPVQDQPDAVIRDDPPATPTPDVTAADLPIPDPEPIKDAPQDAPQPEPKDTALLSARPPAPASAAPPLHPTPSRKPKSAAPTAAVLAPFPPTPADPGDMGPARYRPIARPAQSNVPTAPPVRTSVPAGPVAPPAQGVSEVEDPTEAPAPVPEPPRTAPAATPAPAFSTRRGAAPDVSPPPIAPPVSPPKAPVANGADTRVEAPTFSKVPPASATPSKVTLDGQSGSFAGEAERRRLAMARALGHAGSSPDKPSGPNVLSRLGGAVTGVLGRLKPAQSRQDSRPSDPTPSPKPAKGPSRFARKPKVPDEAATARSREAEALTVFGERKATPQRGGSKYMGLILTLVLILLMAVAAIWSTFVLDDEVALFNPDAADEPAAVVDTPQTPQDTPTAEAPVVEDNAAVLSPEAAEARYAATGVWQRAPDPLGDPVPDRGEDVYIASIDPAIGAADALSLPDPGAINSEPPATPAPPPPPGTTFDLNDQGLVIATPDGAVSPTGALVFAGPPPLVPPARPIDLAPPAAEPQDDASLALDPQEPGLRPRERPENLAELTERSQLGGQSLAELAEIRPRGRPADLNTALPEDTQTAEGPAEAPTAEIDALVTEVAFNNATDLAVEQSSRPRDRPGNFTQIVARAQQRSATPPAQNAAPAPQTDTIEDDGEPEVVVASAAPSRIPTAASVAQSATMKNALNLRNINLIGIYGSKSTRRALVRMTNGRYVKVGIGDKLDGGRVTSISASRLIYQKGNRQIALDVLPLG